MIKKRKGSQKQKYGKPLWFKISREVQFEITEEKRKVEQHKELEKQYFKENRISNHWRKIGAYSCLQKEIEK